MRTSRSWFSFAVSSRSFSAASFSLAHTLSASAWVIRVGAGLAYALMASYATPMGRGAACLKPYASPAAHWCSEHGLKARGVATSGERFDC